MNGAVSHNKIDFLKQIFNEYLQPMVADNFLTVDFSNSAMISRDYVYKGRG